MKRFFKALTAGLLLSQAMAAVSAVIVLDGGPVFGPPIDVTGAVFAGSVANGGQTGTYNNLGNSTVANIYFGLNSTGGPWGWSGDMDGIVTAAEQFTWHADTANSIEYRGSTAITTAFGSSPVLTRLRLTAAVGGTVVSDSTTLALGNSVHSLFHWTGGTFQVIREIEVSADGGALWQDALPYFNSLSTLGQTARTNINTGFYWQNNSASVPEPGTLALASFALLCLGMSCKRTLK